MENQLINWWFAKSKHTAFNILDHGRLNPSDGPDILNATVSINNIIYSGEIEFDWNFDGWFKHGHFQSSQFRNCLLHIYQVGNPVPYSGNQPKFTYCPHNNFIQPNQSHLLNFLERKFQFFESFNFVTPVNKLFWVLFGRSLGFYHNRDAMTYFALRCIEKPIVDETIASKLLMEYQINSSSKQVRPNNRIEFRSKQWLEIWNTQIDLCEKVFNLIKERLPLSILTKQLWIVVNQDIDKKYHASKQRLNLFLLNSLIPLILYRTAHDNLGFINYMHSILTELSLKPDIRQIHRNQSIF